MKTVLPASRHRAERFRTGYSPNRFAARPTDFRVVPAPMVDCEMDTDCERTATRRLRIAYSCGTTCEEYYCDGHARTVREEFDLDLVEIVETEPLR